MLKSKWKCIECGLWFKTRKQLREHNKVVHKHSDLAPTEVTSTRFVENFDAKKWVNDLHEMNRKMYDLEIELKIAQDLYDTWFK